MTIENRYVKYKIIFYIYVMHKQSNTKKYKSHFLLFTEYLLRINVNDKLSNKLFNPLNLSLIYYFNCVIELKIYKIIV